jgi:hypothetical protein
MGKIITTAQLGLELMPLGTLTDLGPAATIEFTGWTPSVLNRPLPSWP